MLDDLVGLVEALKQRIDEHGSSLRENETRTRMALIDPLLQKLGWDTADPAVVTPEYNVNGQWADYALLGDNGKPAATVEAKKLNESLGSPQIKIQMLNYANASGVGYAGLTNGNQWQLYEVFKQGPLEERRILDVSIADQPAHESALKLLKLWRSNLESGRPVAAGKPILDAARTKPVPAPVAPIESQQIPTTATRPSDWVALSNYNPLARTGAPTKIRFSDKSVHSIKNWADLLTATATWLHSNGWLNPPVANSKKRFIVNTDPVHQDGTRFKSSKPVSGTPPLMVEVHGSASAIREVTKKLLKHCDQDPGNVWVQPR